MYAGRIKFIGGPRIEIPCFEVNFHTYDPTIYAKYQRSSLVLRFSGLNVVQHRTSKLRDHPLSTTDDFSFIIIYSQLSSTRNLRTGHAVVTSDPLNEASVLMRLLISPAHFLIWHLGYELNVCSVLWESGISLLLKCKSSRVVAALLAWRCC
jgi:hypothetical protein